MHDRMALADAQSLAIRKLLSKAAFESTLSPGPPLPKSHPSTALIAKLHLDCAELYSSARTLAMAPSKPSLTSGLKVSFGSTSKSDGGGGSGEVSADLLKYLERETKFHTAIAHKWLGVDAGETAKPGKGGEAVGFLKWAQQELEDLHTPRLSKGLGIGKDAAKDRDQDGKRQDRKARTEKELKSVKVFLEHYRKINDSVGRILDAWRDYSFSPDVSDISYWAFRLVDIRPGTETIGATSLDTRGKDGSLGESILIP